MSTRVNRKPKMHSKIKMNRKAGAKIQMKNTDIAWFDDIHQMNRLLFNNLPLPELHTALASPLTQEN